MKANAYGLAAVLTALLMAACQAPAPIPRSETVAGLQTRQVDINGVRLNYIEQGQGTAVVFVHGSLADLRIWEAQRLAVAQHHRYIALTQRYFGTAPWPGGGNDFSQQTHVSDLAAFIQSLGAGPVHLVGWSYGGLTALLVARAHPQLVRSLTLHEPGVRSLIAEGPEGKLALAEFSRAAAPAAVAARAGDTVRSAKLFAEAMYSLPPDGFDAEPQPFRRIVLDNARTMELALQAPPPPTVACDSLRTLRVPTLVTRGENAQAQYRLICERVTVCLGNAQLAIIPGGAHDAPIKNAGVFNATLLSFISKQEARTTSPSN
jgi:pimeloyl-ACP methyl ester carboxylesterase